MPEKKELSEVNELGANTNGAGRNGTLREKGRRRKKRKKNTGSNPTGAGQRVAFPKDSLAKSLRIPQGVLDQNAGNECTDREAAGFAKIGWSDCR